MGIDSADLTSYLQQLQLSPFISHTFESLRGNAKENQRGKKTQDAMYTCMVNL